MIQHYSILNVADNSGVKTVNVIRVLGGSFRRYASIGDLVVVSARNVSPKSKIKKGSIHRALIVRCAKEISREDGSRISFEENAVVLIKVNKGVLDPIGTRIFGPVAREIKKNKCPKIVSLSSEVF